jgi:hypothetical protein
VPKQKRIPTSRRVIDDRLDAVAASLPILVARLCTEGFVFARPEDLLPGIDPAIDRQIRRIEKEMGAVPYAVSQFWRRIGSVDLCGSHPAWKGCKYPDPLVVYPASAAIGEIQEFLDDREERMRCGFPYVIPIAPDDHHKEDVSGGMWYNVDCPAVADDPPLNDERHAVTFTEYLGIAFRCGGFPGLGHCRRHNWPVERLTVGLK